MIEVIGLAGLVVWVLFTQPAEVSAVVVVIVVAIAAAVIAAGRGKS